MANHFFMSKKWLRMTAYFFKPRIKYWLGHIQEPAKLVYDKIGRQICLCSGP